MEKEKKEENSTELQKPNIEAEVYDNDKKKIWLRKKENKKLESLIGFLSANKINSYKRGVERGKINPKESTEKVKKK